MRKLPRYLLLAVLVGAGFATASTLTGGAFGTGVDTTTTGSTTATTATTTAATTTATTKTTTTATTPTTTRSTTAATTTTPSPHKVLMCHFTNSTTNPFVEIDVDSAAVPAHEAIGDKVGHCTTTTVVVIKQMLGLVPAKTTPTSNGMLLMCLHRHTKTHQFVTVSMTNASATAAMHRHVALFGACTHAKVSLLKANGHRR